MNYFIDILSLTATATTLFAEGELVDFNDAKITADDQPVKGVAKHPATEIGMSVAVVAIGVGRSRATGAIAKGAKLISSAGGGVKAAGSSPANAFAMALNAAADGEFVSYLIR